jgi:hypothetical protein
LKDINFLCYLQKKKHSKGNPFSVDDPAVFSAPIDKDEDDFYPLSTYQVAPLSEEDEQEEEEGEEGDDDKSDSESSWTWAW